MIGYMKDDREFKLERTPVYTIGDDGNVLYEGNFKLHLTKNEISVTKDYWNLMELGKDHYIVCDVQVLGCYLGDIDEYSMDQIESLKPQFKFKFGIIRLQRDDKGEVIPFAEKVVVPIVYDRITENNERTVTAYHGKKLTYIDLNPESLNYGKQLAPAILEHAVPFNVPYAGFAECSVDGVTGYLPRNCDPKRHLTSSSLLTKQEVESILSQRESQALPESEVHNSSKPIVFQKIYNPKETK